MIYRVRRMAAGDVGVVTALAASLPTAPHWPQETYLSALDPQARPLRTALVAEAWGSRREIAGFALASIIPPEAELESICVAPEFQRMGIARRLFEVLGAELAAAKVTEVLLEVRASNSVAIEAYRAFGFAETGLRKGYYAEPLEDAVLMRRIIA